MIDKKMRPIVLMLCGICLFAGICTGQSKIREVTNMKPYRNSPIAIVSKELDSKSFIENKLDANQDWLKHLTIGIQNLSEKDITFISIELVISKQGNMTADLAVPMLYHPGTEPNPKNPNESKRRVLAPGEIVRLTVEDHYYLWAMDILRNSGVEDFEEIKIDVRHISFDDGSRWSVGFELIPNSDTKRPSPMQEAKPFLFFRPIQPLVSRPRLSF